MTIVKNSKIERCADSRYSDWCGAYIYVALICVVLIYVALICVVLIYVILTYELLIRGMLI